MRCLCLCLCIDQIENAVKVNKTTGYMVTTTDHPHSQEEDHEYHDRAGEDSATPQGGYSSHPSLQLLRESSFTTGVRPGQLPKIAQSGGVHAPSSSVRGKHGGATSGQVSGSSRRGSNVPMGVPGGAGLPLLEKGKHQMIAWGEHTTQGGTGGWQRQGNEQGQGLAAPGQGLGYRPMNNNLAEGGGLGQGQLRNKRPSSANPHAHPRNNALLNAHGNVHGDSNGNGGGNGGGNGNGGNGNGIVGGKRHAFAGVAEATAVSGALLRITDALVRKVCHYLS